MPTFPGYLDRRAFLQSTLAAAAACSFRASPAFAQSRAETLLVVQELGPNSLDMQGVGSNQTVNGLAWNCYDRLMTYAAKTLPDGTVIVRPRHAGAGTGRELAGRLRRHVVHLHAAQGRDVS